MTRSSFVGSGGHKTLSTLRILRVRVESALERLIFPHSLKTQASRKAPSRKQGAQKTVRQQSTGTEQRGLLKDARGLVMSKSTRFNSAINRHFLRRSGLRSVEASQDDREPAVVGRNVPERECWIPHAKVAKTEPFNCQSIPATGGLCRVPSSLSKD